MIEAVYNNAKNKLVFLVRLFLLILIFFKCEQINAQQTDAIAELHKIAAVYNQDATYSMNLFIKYFSPYESNSLIDTMNISMVINKSEFYYRMREYEFICHDGYYLQVNHKDREIYLSSSKIINNAPYNIQLIDSIVTAYHASGTISDGKPGTRIITLLLPGSTMPEMKITYDTKNYTLLKSVIKYVQNINPVSLKPSSMARVEIEYSNQKKTQKPFPASTYPLSKFVTLKGKEATLASNYKNYKLNNYLKQ